MANVSHSEIPDHIVGGGDAAFSLQSFKVLSYSAEKSNIAGVWFPGVIPWHQSADTSVGLCGSQQIDTDL